MKDNLKMLEKIDLANKVVELATFDNGDFNCLYLQLGKVVFTTLSYYEDRPDILEDCPKIESENGDVIDLFATYDQIMESGMWSSLEKNIDVKISLAMIDALYEEKKVKLLNTTKFENRVLEIVEELKEKISITLDKMDIESLQSMLKDVPNILEGLTTDQKSVLSNLVTLDKQTK